jgi:hypothetical protein
LEAFFTLKTINLSEAMKGASIFSQVLSVVLKNGLGIHLAHLICLEIENSEMP